MSVPVLRSGGGWTSQQDEDLKHYSSLRYDWPEIAQRLWPHSARDCQERYEELQGRDISVLNRSAGNPYMGREDPNLGYPGYQEAGALRPSDRYGAYIASDSYRTSQDDINWGDSPPQTPQRNEHQSGGDTRANQRWSRQEDELIRRGYQQSRPWRDIARQLPGKDERSCMNRWHHTLKYQQ